MEQIYKEWRQSELIYNMIHKSAGDYNFHWHENIEICRVHNKPCRFFADGEIIHANPGDIVVFSEFAIHRFLIDHDHTDIHICQMSVSVLLNSGVIVKPLKTHITLKEMKSIPGLVEQIEGIINLMAPEHRAEKATSNPVLGSLASALYFSLMRHFATDKISVTSKKDRREFYKITEYINQHFTEDITVSRIAKELCMPRGKVSEIFAKFAETSVTAYINTMRINYANQLVAEGNSITVAAYESGFQSMRTFNDVYRKIMKITPSEYIKQKSE